VNEAKPVRRDNRARLFVALSVAATMLWCNAATADESTERGELLYHAGGCESCHTDRANGGKPLAGGPAIATPFGTFYAPNITPDRTHGIGTWSEADFHRVMRRGISPEGEHYFPVFPYTSFTNITDSDLADLWAYLRTVAPSDRPNRAHDVEFPFGWRFLQIGWRWFNFSPGPFRPDSARPQDWNRGAYLVKALVHCGECHTPRNALGGLEYEDWLAGTSDGPDGHLVPNITPDRDTGIGSWSIDEIVQYLATGLDPSGHDAQYEMAEVVIASTSKLSDKDLKAIAVYLKSLPPIRNALDHRHNHGDHPPSH
jgi:mono/diheme cytochrome c family protein